MLSLRGVYGGCRAGLVLALLALCLVACSPARREQQRAELAFDRPATLSSLRLRAQRAIREDNAVGYVALLATASEVWRACPGRFEGREMAASSAKWQQAIERVRSGVGGCKRLVPWSRARKVQERGGEPLSKLPKCKEEVWRLSDITMIFEAGRERYEVLLRQPYRRGSALYGFSDGPRCRLLPPGGEASKAAEPSPATPR